MLYLVESDPRGMFRSDSNNPVAIAKQLVKLMTFYYPNHDPAYMHNISSYFLASNFEAARFNEFSHFVCLPNPVLAFCRALINFGDSGQINRRRILVDLFKVLLFVLKESEHRDFVSLDKSCPWLFVGNQVIRPYRQTENSDLVVNCVVSEFFQVLFDRLKIDYLLVAQLASVVNNLEKISEDVSKQYFEARVTNSDDIGNVSWLQLFSASQAVSDTTTRKLCYSAAVESAEKDRKLQEICRLMALWSDVDLLKDILRDAIGQTCNQISFEIHRQNMVSLTSNFERIRDLIEGLHLIHRTRKDFDQCYCDFKRTYLLMAKLFMTRKERLGDQARKLMFREKLTLVNLLISYAEYYSNETSEQLERLVIKEEHSFSADEYFKQLGFPKMKCNSSTLTEKNLKSIQVILKTVVLVHQA